MTIKQLFFVVCDSCGAQAGGSDNMGSDARAALTLARDAGFRRRKRDGRMVDLCQRCRAAMRQV
jgi:hypothetical protein